VAEVPRTVIELMRWRRLASGSRALKLHVAQQRRGPFSECQCLSTNQRYPENVQQMTPSHRRRSGCLVSSREIHCVVTCAKDSKPRREPPSKRPRPQLARLVRNDDALQYCIPTPTIGSNETSMGSSHEDGHMENFAGLKIISNTATDRP
jgi:hypothetical protein